MPTIFFVTNNDVITLSAAYLFSIKAEQASRIHTNKLISE